MRPQSKVRVIKLYCAVQAVTKFLITGQCPILKMKMTKSPTKITNAHQLMSSGRFTALMTHFLAIDKVRNNKVMKKKSILTAAVRASE